MILESLPEDLCFEGREVEISQVVLNLLSNASDAIETLSDKWIKLSVFSRQDFVEIHITDSGDGIRPEIRKKIFQPFFTTKAIGRGTGMGLSISSGIIQKHRGELQIDSQNPNTCFIIRLPKKQQSSN